MRMHSAYKASASDVFSSACGQTCCLAAAEYQIASLSGMLYLHCFSLVQVQH